MRKYLLSIFMLVSIVASAQKTLNDYKYAIVPLKYDFLSEENKFRLNTITKHNLVKMGFEAYYENENLPSEAANDRCSRLYVNVENEKGFLQTKLSVVFRDCDNKIVYKSEPGVSKNKEFKFAYPQALDKAFTSVNKLGYKYNGSYKSTVVTNVEKKSEAPVSSVQIDETKEYLFAQPITNGYQLVDKTPKIVLKIYKTSQPDYFTAQGDGINGALLKKNGEWILEYYKNDQPVSEKLLIKF